MDPSVRPVGGRVVGGGTRLQLQKQDQLTAVLQRKEVSPMSVSYFDNSHYKKQKTPPLNSRCKSLLTEELNVAQDAELMLVEEH